MSETATLPAATPSTDDLLLEIELLKEELKKTQAQVPTPAVPGPKSQKTYLVKPSDPRLIAEGFQPMTIPNCCDTSDARLKYFMAKGVKPRGERLDYELVEPPKVEEPKAPAKKK